MTNKSRVARPKLEFLIAPGGGTALALPKLVVPLLLLLHAVGVPRGCLPVGGPAAGEPTEGGMDDALLHREPYEPPRVREGVPLGTLPRKYWEIPGNTRNRLASN